MYLRWSVHENRRALRLESLSSVAQEQAEIELFVWEVNRSHDGVPHWVKILLCVSHSWPAEIVYQNSAHW